MISLQMNHGQNRKIFTRVKIEISFSLACRGILVALSQVPRRFGELSDDLPEITDRMLSRELRELETNLLVTRCAVNDKQTKGMYEITDHGKSLHHVVLELSKWGIHHRKFLAGK